MNWTQDTLQMNREGKMPSKEKSKSGSRLGRGLEGLFDRAVSGEASPPVEPQKEVSVPDEKRVWSVAVEKIVANKDQPRKKFDKEPLKELADSIREKGVIQPILARKLDNGKFEIIAGERRWRASQMAGLHEVPVVLRKYNNKDNLEVSIIENVQRRDLNSVEEAEAYQFLMDSYSMTQKEVAEKVGKDRATVANSLRLLSLVPEVRQLLVDSRLSAGHARALLSVEDPREQFKLAQEVLKNKLSVRATESLVNGRKGKADQKLPNDGKKNLSSHDKMIQKLAEDLQKLAGTGVKIDYSAGKGRVSLLFYTDEELNKIVDIVRGGCQK